MIETQMRREAERARGTRHRRGAPLRLRTGTHPLHVLLRSRAARPLRFALTGGFAGLLQLGLLAVLTGHGWPAALANAVAFLLAAQVNFALSSLFTWRDRRRTAPLWRRWLAFHGAIAAMALVNQSVFLAAWTALPALVASAAGIAVAAVGNYLLGDRLVFRVHGHQRRPSLFLALSSTRKTADALVRQHHERPAIITSCAPDDSGRLAGAALSSHCRHPVSEASLTRHGAVMAPSYAEGVLMSGGLEESPLDTTHRRRNEPSGCLHLRAGPVRARPARECPRGPAGARRGTMDGLGVPCQPIGPAARGPPLRKGRAQRPRRIVRQAIGALAARRGQPMDKRTNT